MVRQKQFAQEWDHTVPFWRRTSVILLAILLLAAVLRLVNLGQSPPGLNQDEAANAWNAYCLLKTGEDQVGVSWPIFYIRALGSNRSTLYIYLLMPFQAIGGLNILTTRLPAAVTGILTILVVYYVGKRLFNRQVGLIAAVLLAVNPWHIQQSRWGHEASICALLGLAPLAMLLWANMPLSDHRDRRLRPIAAAIAGAVTGIVCYGYQATRIFVPLFVAAMVIVTLPAWWRYLKTKRGAITIGAFVVALAFTLGPLAWQHVFHSDEIARRGQSQLQWIGSEPFLLVLKNISIRYIRHFGLDFLFIQGDRYAIQSPPGVGQYHWYMLPLMLLGLAALLKRLKTSRAARILLAFIITYPLGDSISRISQGESLHALRSSPGLSSLIILAALGTVTTATWLYQRNRLLSTAALTILVIYGAVVNVRYLNRFFGPYNQQKEIYHSYQVDLIEACNWLRPRLDEVDAVFCTIAGMNMPYIITLVGLKYDPDRWFRDGRDFITLGEFDYYTRYGKMHFIYGDSSVPALDELQKREHRARVIFIARPGEFGLKEPVHKIYRPDGQEVLWICQL